MLWKMLRAINYLVSFVEMKKISRLCILYAGPPLKEDFANDDKFVRELLNHCLVNILLRGFESRDVRQY